MDKKSKGKSSWVSGGVDSSVSAALLQKQGLTIGVFLKVWQPEFLRGSGVHGNGGSATRCVLRRICTFVHHA